MSFVIRSFAVLSVVIFATVASADPIPSPAPVPAPPAGPIVISL